MREHGMVSISVNSVYYVKVRWLYTYSIEYGIERFRSTEYGNDRAEGVDRVWE